MKKIIIIVVIIIVIAVVFIIYGKIKAKNKTADTGSTADDEVKTLEAVKKFIDLANSNHKIIWQKKKDGVTVSPQEITAKTKAISLALAEVKKLGYDSIPNVEDGLITYTPKKR